MTNHFTKKQDNQLLSPTRRMTLATVAALAALWSAPMAANAQNVGAATAEKTSRSGVVYVESNIATANGNAILAYRRDKRGQLTPLPGSPFLTRGAGVSDPTLALGPFDSDQLIITNADHTLLFAVNPGSNTIAVFHIAADGSLSHVDGSPFASGGINPVSLGLSRDTLVVVNKAMDPNQATHTGNYVSFRVSPDGQLSPVPLSVKNVAVGASPSQALISPDKTFVFGADFLAGNLQSFVIQSDGTLSQNLPQTVPDAAFGDSKAPRLPLGLAAHPNRPVVYVGLVTINKIAVYQYDAQGKLRYVKSVADTGSGPCWVRVSLDGTRMYASNTGDNSISVFDTSDALTPVEIQKLDLKGVGSSFQVELDPANGYLYVVSQRASTATPIGQGNALHVVKVKQDGRLLEEENSPYTIPVPNGVRSQGLATF